MVQSTDFKIELPREDWEDQTVYAFKAPRVADTDHWVLMTIDRQLRQDTVEKFAKEKIKAIAGSLQSVEVLKDQEVTLKKGNPVYEYVIKGVIGHQLSRYRKYVFVFYDNRGFTINTEFTKKSYKLLNPQLKELIEYFFPGTYKPLEKKP